MMPQTTAESPPRWGVRYDARFTAPLLITGILLGGHLSFGMLESYWQTGLAIATSVLVEVVLSRSLVGRWPHLASAYISGISVGILIRSPLYWPFAACAALAILSKYVLRYRGRHLWNPSNFGICAMLLLAPDVVAHLSVQWGNNVWPMLVIWVLGSAIIWRLHRFHICATYVAGFLVFAFLRTWFTGDGFAAEVAPLTGPMYQLFVFFMITDPRTTVAARWGQAATAFAVAFVEALLRLGEVVHAPFYALFLVGPVALLLEMAWTSRRHAPAQAATQAA